MDLIDAVLDSWDRQSAIVGHVASLVDESNRKARPSPDGWPLDTQLAHMAQVRRYWLSQFSPAHAEGIPSVFVDGWQTPIDDLDAIKSALNQTSEAVRAAVGEALRAGKGASGGYDHPLLFLQHMIWHEGWHVGLIFLGLRLCGREPSDEWEEHHVWGRWRTESW